jgi:hypothetical protein
MTKVKGSVVNRRSIFPEGHFVGEVAGPAGEDASYLQQNDDGSRGNIVFQLVNNTAVEADVEPGARRCFVRIPVWWTGKDEKGKDRVFQVTEVADDPDLQDDESVPFPIRGAVGTFAQLAAALGMATVTDTGDVEGFEMEGFVESLKNGEFEGMSVEFIVSHRAEKDRETKKPTGRKFEQVDFVVPEPGADSEEEEDTSTDTEDAPVKGSGKPKFQKRR